MKKCTYALEHAWKDGRCCCNCRNHIQDMSHPRTDGGNATHQKGWICLIPKMGKFNQKPIAFSSWSEHGFCELYNPMEGE